MRDMTLEDIVSIDTKLSNKNVVVLYDTGERKNKSIISMCLCYCGRIFKCKLSNLTCGRTVGCGCHLNKKMVDTKSMIGTTINHIQVLDIVRQVRIRLSCKCHCGKEFTCGKLSLINGSTTSCGCLKRLQLEGKKYGNWIVLSHHGTYIGKNTRRDVESTWLCECQCENKTKRIIKRTTLTKGRSMSCGCIKRPHNINVRSVTLSKQCMKRDNYVCQVCGCKTRHLNAHHLYSWKYFPSLRFQLSNLITLCCTKRDKNGNIINEGCHEKFHSIYSNKRNTKEQFTEFLKSEQEKNNAI